MSEWLIILFVILLSGFFSGSEIGFVSANRLKLEIRSRKDTLNGRILNRFVQNPESFLSTTLIGNNIVNVIYATLMAIYLAVPIEFYYDELIGGAPSPFTVLIVQTVIASFIIMIFGEVIPKAMYRVHSDFLISLFAVPLRICNWVFRPFIFVANSTASFLIQIFRPQTAPEERVFRRQDIEMLLNELRDEGGADLDKEDSEILSNVLELSTKRVKETMIPRTDIVAVEKNTSLDEVLKTFVSSGFSKLPVYEGNTDNIVGVVFAYDLFKSPKNLEEVIRPVKFIPSSQRSRDLLSEFQRMNISMAIVIDEYGGTAGLVTIEDLLEEVVGDIQDEYDTEEKLVRKIAANTFVVSGDMKIEELNEEYPEIALPEKNGEFETVAGYIIHEIGRIPKVNEEILLSNCKFIVSKATQSRIETVKLVLLDERL